MKLTPLRFILLLSCTMFALSGCGKKHAREASIVLTAYEYRDGPPARDRPLVSPEVEILTPVAGFKIHREDTLTVRVRMKIVPGSRLPSLLTITYESREKNRVHGHIVPQCAGTVLIQQVRNEGDGYVCEGVLPSPAMNWKGRWIDVTIGIVNTEIVWMPSGPAKITNTDWDSKPVVIEIIDK